MRRSLYKCGRLKARNGITQQSDNTRRTIPITNLPMDDSAESKFYRDLAALSAMTDEERAKEDFYNRAHNTGTIAPTDMQARTGWMEVNPLTGDVTPHAPTIVSAAPLTEGQRMWNSPVFQLALTPMFDAPFILNSINKARQTIRLANNVEKANNLRKAYTNPRITITPVEGEILTGTNLNRTNSANNIRNNLGHSIEFNSSEGLSGDEAVQAAIRDAQENARAVQINQAIPINQSVETIPNVQKQNTTSLVQNIEDYINGNDASLDNIIDVVSSNYNVPKKVLKDYISRTNNPAVSRYERKNFLTDIGIRYYDASNPISDYIPYSLRKEFKDYHVNRLRNSPTEITDFKNFFRNRTNKDLKYYDDDDIINILSDFYGSKEKAFNNLIDRSRILRELGDDKWRVISNKAIEELNKLGFNKNIIDTLIDNDKIGYTLSGFTSNIKRKLKELPTVNINKIFTEKPKFSLEEGSSFSPDELEFYVDFNNTRSLHPNISRGDYNSRMIRNIDNKFNEAIDSDFQITEQAGTSFSANSYPMLLHKMEQLSNERIKRGKFPGMIIPDRSRYIGTTYGNSFGNVNLGTKAKPEIGAQFGYVPTPEEIAKYPDRNYAVNVINKRLAKLYKTIQENSNYNNAANYDFNKDILNAVIKANGDLTKVPGAESLVFPNTKVPLWASFPDTSDSPIYPAVRYFFRNGGIKRKSLETI